MRGRGNNTNGRGGREPRVPDLAAPLKERAHWPPNQARSKVARGREPGAGRCEAGSCDFLDGE